MHLLRPEGRQGKSPQFALEKGSVSIALDRIRFFVAKLSDERTTRSERMACWELIAKAARLGLEGEVQEMNELNAVMSDPAMEVPI